MYYFRIAFRNLFRRKRRTFVAAGVLAFAILVFLLIDSFMLGMLEISFSNLIDFETAHVQIARSDFFAEDGFPLDEVFSFTGEKRELLEAREEVIAFTPLLEFQADLIAGREEFPVKATAIETESFNETFRVNDYMVEGEFVEPGESGVVIGRQLADMMELEVGDFYTLHFQDDTGAFNTLQGEVRGIVSTPSPQVNRHTAFVSHEYAHAAVGVEEDKASQVMAQLNEREKAGAVASELDGDVGGGLMARSYRESSEMLESMEVWITIENYVILGLILLVGAIGIINVIVLSALERVEEIGLMKAMGLKEKEIVRVFSLEAGGIGLLGGLMGCLLGAISVGLFARYGLDLEAVYGDGVEELGLPILERLYGVWNPSAFAFMFIFVTILALVASLLPSFWAARKDPIDAIYHR